MPPLSDLIRAAAAAVGGGYQGRRLHASMAALAVAVGIPRRTLYGWLYERQQPWPRREAAARARLAEIIEQPPRPQAAPSPGDGDDDKPLHIRYLGDDA